jgi:hypothetical protein
LLANNAHPSLGEHATNLARFAFRVYQTLKERKLALEVEGPGVWPASRETQGKHTGERAHRAEYTPRASRQLAAMISRPINA